VKWLALVLVLATGCVSAADDAGAWIPAAAAGAELGPPPAPRDPPVGTLRVATWNVHFAADPANLAAHLRASRDIARADVLLVQEIEAYPGEPASRARLLAEALDMTWAYAPARAVGTGTHGIAILARYPLANVMVRDLPYIDQPIRARERIALAADIVLGDRSVRVVDLHLDVRIGGSDRVRQLHPAVIDAPAAAVVGGDFNSNPWAWVDATVPLIGTQAIVDQDQASVLDDYLAALDFASAIPADVATLRVPAYDIRVDDLYARELPIAAAGVEHVDGSDHWPVWFDVAP